MLERAAAELPLGRLGPSRPPAGWRTSAGWTGRSSGPTGPSTEAADSRRLNPRAVGTADTDPRLRSGLDALEHSVVALRALFRSIADGVLDAVGEEAGYTPELLEAFALLLARPRRERPRLRGAGALRVARRCTRERRRRWPRPWRRWARRGPGSPTCCWSTPARTRTGGCCGGPCWRRSSGCCAELDVEERLRRRRQWESEAAERGPATQAVARLRGTGPAAARPGRRGGGVAGEHPVDEVSRGQAAGARCASRTVSIACAPSDPGVCTDGPPARSGR